MSYKTYGEYKDSNVELLGKIPQNWEITKIRFLGSLQNGISKSSKYFGHGYPFISYGDVYNNDELPNKISGKANTSIYERKNYSVVKNDIFFTRTSETIEEVGITSLCTKTIENATFSGFLIRLRLFKNLDMDVNFLKYYLQSNFIRHYFAKMMIIVTRASLGQNLLKNLSILLPSTKEQQQIVRYLDKKIRIINKMIIKNRELINLLEEKRISLTNQVVTKGLNSDVLMKNSMIEWIGEIPENWKITKIRFLGSLQNGISKSSEYFGHGYPFISYGDVYNNNELPEKIDGKAMTSISERIVYSVKENDIFFTRTSETIDEVGISSICKKTIKNATFSGFLIRLRLFKNKNININFLKYYLQSDLIRHYFAKMMTIVTRASLGQNLLKNLSVLLPPIEEQKTIVEYLDKETSKIDKTIDKIKENIELLEEYKTSLIHHVVTGKIDVRGEEI